MASLSAYFCPDLHSWCWASPAFLGLGLLIGGTLKPEAVLALANTLWIVMAGLGAIIIPASEYPSWWGAIVEFTPPVAGPW